MPEIIRNVKQSDLIRLAQYSMTYEQALYWGSYPTYAPVRIATNMWLLDEAIQNLNDLGYYIEGD